MLSCLRVFTCNHLRHRSRKLTCSYFILTKKYYYLKGRKLDQYHCGRHDENLFINIMKGPCEVKNLEFTTKLSINSFGVRDSEESLKGNLRHCFYW